MDDDGSALRVGAKYQWITTSEKRRTKLHGLVSVQGEHKYIK
jgi:hypothetical protein